MASQFKTFADGDVLTASEVNSYLMKQAVIVCDSSADYPTSPVEGMYVYDKALDSYVGYNGSAWVQFGSIGAAGDTAWEPTITQSSTISRTNTRSVYVRQGQVVHCWCDLAVTGTGSTAEITVDLPVAASGYTAGACIGVGNILDAGSTNVNVGVLIHTSTLVKFQTDAASYYGTALAAGDRISFQATYLVA